MACPQSELSPAAVLLFAFLGTRMAKKPRKKRDAILMQMLLTLEAIADDPVDIRRPRQKGSERMALEWFRRELPKLRTQ